MDPNCNCTKICVSVGSTEAYKRLLMQITLSRTQRASNPGDNDPLAALQHFAIPNKGRTNPRPFPYNNCIQTCTHPQTTPTPTSALILTTTSKPIHPYPTPPSPPAPTPTPTPHPHRNTCTVRALSMAASVLSACFCFAAISSLSFLAACKGLCGRRCVWHRHSVWG